MPDRPCGLCWYALNRLSDLAGLFFLSNDLCSKMWIAIHAEVTAVHYTEGTHDWLSVGALSMIGARQHAFVN